MSKSDAKPFIIPENGDKVNRYVSLEEVMIRQILSNQLLIMSNLQYGFDVYSQNSFQQAINKTQELLKEDSK